jgi:hypothetical protein
MSALLLGPASANAASASATGSAGSASMAPPAVALPAVAASAEAFDYTLMLELTGVARKFMNEIIQRTREHVLHESAKVGLSVSSMVPNTGGKYYPDDACSPCPHTTLKYTFTASANELAHLEAVLKEFAASDKVQALKDRAAVLVGGLGNFGSEVLFIKVEANLPALVIYHELMEVLHSIPWLKFRTFNDGKIEGGDSVPHWHSSLVLRTSSSVWEMAKSYVESKEDTISTFASPFNGISIVRKYAAENDITWGPHSFVGF